MKICIDTHLSDTQMTGIGRYINRLVSNLAELDQNNEYILICYGGTDKNHPLQTLQGKHIRKIPVHIKGPSLKQHRVISRILKEVQPDVYHHPHFDLPLFHRVPSVITVHDLKYIHNPEFFEQNNHLKRCYMKGMMQLSLKRAAQTICVSDFTRADILRLFHPLESKLTVIHHGYTPVEENNEHQIDNNVVSDLINRQIKYILCVGERRPHKNLTALLHAFNGVLKKTDQSLHLVIAGKPYKNYTEPEACIKRHHLENKVTLTGYVSDSDLSVLYNHAACLILPSLYEGFGLPLLEAMHRGIPVLGSNVTAIPEVIGPAGLLFNPENTEDMADKLMQITGDHQLRKRMAEKGKARAAEFTWQKVAEKTLEIYENVGKTYGV